MSRVSENSSFHAINYSVGKSKTRLENLQLKGSNLKRIQKPSDDPIGNTELLAIRSKNVDSEQYLRNSNVAKTQLSYTENAIEELTDLVVKVKELALGQASNLYSPEVRQSIAKEVNQLRNQAISVANRRLGNRYIFAGHKTLTKPFDHDGKYHGDNQSTSIEVNKDFYVPINFSGKTVFFEKENSSMVEINPLQNTPFQNQEMQKENVEGTDIEVPFAEDMQKDDVVQNRTLASENNQPQVPQKTVTRTSIFSDLERLENALMSNNFEIIQGILPDLDRHVDRLIEVRTKIGAVVNSIDRAEEDIEKTKLLNAEYKSKVEDADVAELFTDLSRQQNVLNATYKSSAQLMNRSLLDFIR
jgi:flagellar hook-associated protein 3 FlgL